MCPGRDSPAPALQLDLSDSERGHSRTGTGPDASILGGRLHPDRIFTVQSKKKNRRRVCRGFWYVLEKGVSGELFLAVHRIFAISIDIKYKLIIKLIVQFIINL